MADAGAKDKTPDHRPQKKNDQREDAPIAEWIAGIIGLLLVAASISVLTYEALQGQASPPDVQVSVIAITEQSGGYLAEIRLTNRGATTAGDLTVAGTLHAGQREVETSEITIDYLPPRSERRAGLFFTRDPRDLRLEIHATGYQEP